MSTITKDQLLNDISNLSRYGKQLAERPDYLYHYTSIKNLAHILQSRKIRFTPLTEKDDKIECTVDSLQHVRKYVFSSSWTDLERENIPFWSMYTDQMKGVRIKLPTYMFTDCIIHIDNTKIQGVQNSFHESIIPENAIFGDNFYILPLSIKNSFTLSRVVYQDDNEVKNCFSKNEDGVYVSYKDWGIIKTKDWEFQSEWRFRILVVPINHALFNAFEDSMKRMIGNEDISIKEIYVDISKEAFLKMEIMLGPKCDDADEIIVKSLVEQYNNSATIMRSELNIR